MFSLPRLTLIQDKETLQNFANTYFKCSGLPIPDAYLYDPKNKIFGIFSNQELIGGYILGNGSAFRTIDIFANTESQEMIYENLEDRSNYTEITCFWIKRAYRTKTSLNFFTWFSMAYALKKYGTKYLLFGTCSRSLARLYGTTSKSMMIHRDFIKKKPTFIFLGKHKGCISGILEIVAFKLKRVFNNSHFTKSLKRVTKKLV